MITKEEWLALKNDEIVKKLFKTLRKEEESRKQAWSENVFGDTRENDIQIGFIQGLRFVRTGEFIEEELMLEETGEFMEEE
jgi:hypothetical protein